jgi:hypothetical protein
MQALNTSTLMLLSITNHDHGIVADPSCQSPLGDHLNKYRLYYILTCRIGFCRRQRNIMSTILLHHPEVISAILNNVIDLAAIIQTQLVRYCRIYCDFTTPAHSQYSNNTGSAASADVFPRNRSLHARQCSCHFRGSSDSNNQQWLNTKL